ncbi:GtrA family protein [Nocardioides guangzhouensis]|uniref:GtrA family protein n=1 Tax=Nocardioides guangzhouensis TaxID=2497878 RepID=A0A4V1XYI7_9ACTN|nr:GtrA family protein [Nocardioides guangzhouensis]RYP83389.1 GtrA family protein [Nocardioides guangzhouensis]
MGRRTRVLSEGGKFVAVGAVATVVALVLFNLLVHGVGGDGPMNGQPLLAFALANLIGMAVSYRGARHWAFRRREPVGPANGRVGFLVVNVVSLLIPMACLAVSRYLLELDGALADNVAANVVGLGLGVLFRFWATRRYVFRRPRGRVLTRA